MGKVMYIVSDLHGCGEVYDSIMEYIERKADKFDEVDFYINGDLVDYGPDSYRIFDDVRRRIFENGKIKIHYVGGEHELLMYRALLEFKSGNCGKYFHDWMNNGGEQTLNGLVDSEDIYEELGKIIEFLENLEVYHKFSFEFNGKPMLLVHGKAPHYVYDDCHLKIADNNREVEDAVSLCPEGRTFIGNAANCSQIGKKGYFTIVGHTPLFKGDKPYKYHSRGNHLNQIVAFSNGLSFGSSDKIKASYILDMRADLDRSRKESDSCAPRISNTEIDCVHIHRTNSCVDYSSEARSGGISIGGTRTVG